MRNSKVTALFSIFLLGLIFSVAPIHGAEKQTAPQSSPSPGPSSVPPKALTPVPAAPVAAPAPEAPAPKKKPDPVFHVRVISSTTPGQDIPDLKFPAKAKLEKQQLPTKEFRWIVRLPTRFKRPDWSIVSINPEIEVSQVEEKVEEFEVLAPIKGSMTPVNVVAVGPEGQVEKEALIVAFDQWEQAEELLGPGVRDTRNKRHVYFPSFGITSLSYSEPNTPNGDVNLSQIGITGKLGYSFLFRPQFDVGVITYLTLLPLSTNISGISARFFGFNGKVGYSHPLKNGWTLGIQTGFYFTTMFVTNDAFGFKNLMGPQLFPVVRKNLSKGAVSGYLKFSPVAASISIQNLSNRELAFGAGYSRPLANGRVVSVNLDFANLALLIDNVPISSTSISLSAGTVF